VAQIVLIAGYLRGHGLLDALSTQVRVVRGRFGRYEVIDFLALLFGYAISGEQTLQAFFDRLHPFAESFMALFERGTLPHRSTLSRFLAAIDSPCLDALQTVFTTSFAAEARYMAGRALIRTVAGRECRTPSHSSLN